MPTRVHLEKDWLLIDFDDMASMESLTDSILKLGSFIVAVPRELPMFRKIACTLQLSEQVSFKTQLEVIQVFPHGKDRYDTALQPVPWGETQKSELNSKRDAALGEMSSQSANLAKGASRSVASRTTAAPAPAGTPSSPTPPTPSGPPTNETSTGTSQPPWKRSRTVASPLTEEEPDLAGNSLVAEALAAVLRAKGKSGATPVPPGAGPAPLPSSRVSPPPPTHSAEWSPSSPPHPAPSPPPPPPPSAPWSPASPTHSAPSPPASLHSAPSSPPGPAPAEAFEFGLETPRPSVPATEATHGTVGNEALTHSETSGPDHAAPEASSHGPVAAERTEHFEPESQNQAEEPSEETDEAALERFARLANAVGSGRSSDYCRDEDMVAAAYAASMSAEALEPFLKSRSLPVLLGLLANRRLEKLDLVKLLNGPGLPSAFLEEVAAHKRWGRVYEVQKALSTRAATPFRVASRLLEQLRKRDLQSISERGDVRESIRKLALQTSLKNWSDLGPPSTRRVAV